MATEQALRDREVSSIIQAQLGRDFFAMVGATNLVYGNEDGLSYLQFRFKMFPKANVLRIILDSDDTYRFRFYSVRGTKSKTFLEEEGIYAEDLHKQFRAVTGLETRMPRFIR
jgi:hypothetical protein